MPPPITDEVVLAGREGAEVALHAQHHSTGHRPGDSPGERRDGSAEKVGQHRRGPLAVRPLTRRGA